MIIIQYFNFHNPTLCIGFDKSFLGCRKRSHVENPLKEKKKKRNQSRPPCNGQQMLFGKNWMAQREIESCRLNDLHTPICWEYRTVGPIRAREGAAFSLSLQISADKSILSLSHLTSYFLMTSLYQFKIFVLISLLRRWCHKK